MHIEDQPKEQTIVDPILAERAAREMGDPNECKRKLVALGCRVSSPSEDVWEILHPSGVTAFARSPEALQVITYRYAGKSTNAA